jgi:phosphate transport system permease protein
MSRQGRRAVDWSFTGLSVFSVVLLSAALLVILLPILVRGAGAFVFRGTVEFRRSQLEMFVTGDRAAVEEEVRQVDAVRKPVYDMLADFDQQMQKDFMLQLDYSKKVDKLRELLQALLGPPPGAARDVMPRDRYGATRWDRAQVDLHNLLYVTRYDYASSSSLGAKTYVPREDDFAGTSLQPLFAYVRDHTEQMLRPRLTFYWRFLTQESVDAHFFGGIWPEFLGTLYLTVGTMVFAVPMGVIAAVYLAEYAKGGRLVSLLRSCISTLAGVPSIVFGLFGLAFFINGVHISENKSVLAGSLTLGLLVLPMVIRASEEAIRAVPATYKEAALSLGAGKWRTVVTVLLPAALPGILTGIVISMGRAAGETAPIMFTAAVSVGKPLRLLQAFTQPTPALPWNIYNLASEHAQAEQIRYVQYGMVATLILMVLLLNTAAFILRARISRKLRG